MAIRHVIDYSINKRHMVTEMLQLKSLKTLLQLEIESKMKAEKVGNLRSCVLQWDGRKFKITLEHFKFLSDLWINLFSINNALMNGFMIGNKSMMI
jgi:hypothetical protein